MKKIILLFISILLVSCQGQMTAKQYKEKTDVLNEKLEENLKVIEDKLKSVNFGSEEYKTVFLSQFPLRIKTNDEIISLKAPSSFKEEKEYEEILKKYTELFTNYQKELYDLNINVEVKNEEFTTLLKNIQDSTNRKLEIEQILIKLVEEGK